MWVYAFRLICYETGIELIRKISGYGLFHSFFLCLFSVFFCVVYDIKIGILLSFIQPLNVIIRCVNTIIYIISGILCHNIIHLKKNYSSNRLPMERQWTTNGMSSEVCSRSVVEVLEKYWYYHVFKWWLYNGSVMATYLHLQWKCIFLRKISLMCWHINEM